MSEPTGSNPEAEIPEELLGSPSQEGRKVARATGLMSILTVLSRLLGVLRDMGQAAVLGTGMAADAFTIAFIIPNILRRLFGESTVSAAFVPTYTDSLVNRGETTARELGRKVVTFVASALLLLVVLGMVFAPVLARIFAPGFVEVPGKIELTTGLLRILFPYIFFVGTGAVYMGILNSHRHFLSPALAPVLFNVCAIAGLFVLGRKFFPQVPVWGYAIGATAGGLLQLAVQLPAARAKGFSFAPDFRWRDSRFLRVLGLAVPALIGLVAAEVNILVDQLIASLLEPGSVAALSYGSRIMHVPLGVFAVALSTALLPTLSRQTALGKVSEARRSLSAATKILAMVLIPAALCLAMLAGPLVSVILARGAFSQRSVLLTSTALSFYAGALLFTGGVRITVPVFYALKDTRTPVKIALACMGLNIILNVLLTWLFITTRLARPLAGLAAASSVSALVNFLLLRLSLKKRIGAGPGPGTRTYVSTALAFLITGGGLMLVRESVRSAAAGSFLVGVLVLLAVCALSVVLFSGCFLLFAGRRALSALEVLRRRGT
ncbi:murein biosynthesis integral membrane protein MurJ [Candidatus Fermentibacteria bacterium]|nr:murein biosynthesis integral membrane protein MurJ [Candidatus Fermentibacteria bacterium]